MKKRSIVNLIIIFVMLSFLCSLFFSTKLEISLKLKADLSKISKNSFEVHFIDVGQGDAIAIRFSNNKTMLVDSGPVSAETNLKEYLDNIFFTDNYNTFDYVFLTHSDIDHSGNMNFILKNYKVNNFYRPHIYSQKLEDNETGFKVDSDVYDNILSILNNKNIATNFCDDSAIIDVGCGSIQIFEYSKLDKLKTTNDFSPTLIISDNNTKICLGGDSSKKVEMDLIEREVLKDVDLLKLSHHGSEGSNSIEFLCELKPEFIVCSAGYNSSNHPSSEVLLRMYEYDKIYGTKIYDNFKSTSNDGNIIYYSNDNSTINLIMIKNVGDYIFINWYSIVLIIEIILIIFLFISIFVKNKISVNRHLKNMKQ